MAVTAPSRGAEGKAYGCFVALGAYRDLRLRLPAPLRMVHP